MPSAKSIDASLSDNMVNIWRGKGVAVSCLAVDVTEKNTASWVVFVL